SASAAASSAHHAEILRLLQTQARRGETRVLHGRRRHFRRGGRRAGQETLPGRQDRREFRRDGRYQIQEQSADPGAANGTGFMKRERGFAILLLFVMAAAIAITLYKELPRVAFEAQRDKEQLLIERGEQYSRSIQLYVRKWKKYPATIEELESTNQIRFLRTRYNDPMTGKS